MQRISNVMFLLALLSAAEAKRGRDHSMLHSTMNEMEGKINTFNEVGKKVVSIKVKNVTILNTQSASVLHRFIKGERKLLPYVEVTLGHWDSSVAEGNSLQCKEPCFQPENDKNTHETSEMVFTYETSEMVFPITSDEYGRARDRVRFKVFNKDPSGDNTEIGNGGRSLKEILKNETVQDMIIPLTQWDTTLGVKWESVSAGLGVKLPLGWLPKFHSTGTHTDVGTLTVQVEVRDVLDKEQKKIYEDKDHPTCINV